ncbi:MAG: hypothetical protein NT120_02440 [Candidatus Aenigmarchaeota archaeon]|nr:hypothetical protein [Candidatus Aenigmarchaeota archaeon]
MSTVFDKLSFSQSVYEFERRSVSPEEITTVLNALNSVPAVRDLFPDAVNRLVETEKSLKNTKNLKQITLEINGEIADKGADIILPVRYRENNDYQGHVKTFVDHCNKVLGQYGNVEFYETCGFLGMKTADGEIQSTCSIISDLNVLPGELIKNHIFLSLDIRVLPSERISEESTTRARYKRRGDKGSAAKARRERGPDHTASETTYEMPRGKKSIKTIMYAFDHDGKITTEEAAKLLGNNASASSVMLSYIKNHYGIFDSLPDRKGYQLTKKGYEVAPKLQLKA